MEVHTDVRSRETLGDTVTVDIRLTGALVARAGARQTRVTVRDGRTLADAIREWGEEYGNHVRFALLEGGRLRSDTLAHRVTGGAEEPLSATSRIHNGDTVRFRLRD